MNTIYNLSTAAQIMGGRFSGSGEATFSYLLTDSRAVRYAGESLFFALAGLRQDGHSFIPSLIERGVQAFVVSRDDIAAAHPQAHFIIVKDTLVALQRLAAHHRSQFKYPIIGITGSNGKTIVKEWLYQLLHEDYHIVRSPKSYNSQIGVPLSIWQMRETHTLGIFEAGISESGEMERLQRMILPTIGIFTNIGEAHSEGFLNAKHKAKEKLKLFNSVDTLIYCADHADINLALAEINAFKGQDSIKTFTWSSHTDADVRVTSILQQGNHSFISCAYRGREMEIDIPFSDRASVENAMHCLCAMLVLGVEMGTIRQRMTQLTRIAMRLELKDAVHQSSLINDSYNSDFESLRIAIDFLQQQNQHPHKILILSDILQSGRGSVELYADVARLLTQHGISRLVAIGTAIGRERKLFEQIAGLQSHFFDTTQDFLQQLDTAAYSDSIILLKGARPFEFEKIALRFEQRKHTTVLEINLNALVQNYKVYQSLLQPTTRIMAMVKAFSYGSGSYEIANILQHNRVDYLAVAYADEGIALRKGGITLPIMVMNPEEESIEAMIAHRLEPDIYSPSLLDKFVSTLHLLQPVGDPPYPIHIEVETGMNRLGFEEVDIAALLDKLHLTPSVRVASVFSHLAGSEAESLDDFTREQIARFEQVSNSLIQSLGYPILRHILNSSGISRHTTAQYDMVRLGIGLYGIDPTPAIQSRLAVVSTLRTTISQIKHIHAGESVGYGRADMSDTDRTIATVGIGYADGLSRRLSQGCGSMWVKGHLAPIIGKVCMDMTMLDITDIADVEVGEEVIVFGAQPSVQLLALWAETIPYEILTGISTRVKRVYYQE